MKPTQFAESTLAEAANAANDGVLSFDGERFRLGQMRPTIYFDATGARVGCKFITADAMDVLCRKWEEFRSRTTKFVVQP